MRKGVTFISAALTAFILAMLAGVVYAYNNGLSASSLFSQQPSNPSSNQPVSLPLIAPTAAAISPRDAAADAAKFMNRTDPYSVQLADYNGQQSYEVTFASGDIAYVSMSGQVLGLAAATPTQAPVYSAPAKGGGKSKPAPSSPPPSGGGHEGGGDGGGGDD